jgi:hypothetical protein
MGNNAASNTERKNFVQIFFVKTVLNTISIRNRKKNFFNVGTGSATATNHYGFTFHNSARV